MQKNKMWQTDGRTDGPNDRPTRWLIGCVPATKRGTYSDLLLLYLLPPPCLTVQHSPLFAYALWSKTTKNPDCSTGPLALLFARSLPLLTYLLAPPCSLHLCAALHSLIPLLAHSLIPLLVESKWLDGYLFSLLFFFVLDHSALPSFCIWFESKAMYDRQTSIYLSPPS